MSSGLIKFILFTEMKKKLPRLLKRNSETHEVTYELRLTIEYNVLSESFTNFKSSLLWLVRTVILVLSKDRVFNQARKETTCFVVLLLLLLLLTLFF